MKTVAKSVSVVLAVYRAVARLLPAGFRETYLPELVRDLSGLLGQARTSGGWPRFAGTTVRCFADLAWRIPTEWLKELMGSRERSGPKNYIDSGVGEGIMTILRDLRLATRALLKRPGFSSIAAFTLALGIGATVAIFTVVNAVLLRPLPYPDSDRIVVVRHHAPGLDLPELNGSLALLRFYSENTDVFEALGAVDDASANLTAQGEPARVRVAQVTREIFNILQVRPIMGRPLMEDDVVEGAPPVAVLTHAGWSSLFGSDPAVLGKTIEIDGEPTEVIGVMPRGFAFPEAETIALLPQVVPVDAGFGTFGITMVGRLAAGVELETVQQRMRDLQIRLPEFFDGIDSDFLEGAGWGVSVDPMRDLMVADIESALWIVLGTVGFLLLIACANVANLFLVRAETRQKEIAIRAALGAGRGSLARSFLTESVLLGALGGALGVGLAALGVRALVAFGPANLPRIQEIQIDGTVLVVAAVLSILAGLSFGALPMTRYLGRAFAQLLRDGGRGSTDGRERHRARNVLVAGQLAMALVLLVGSGLMLRTFAELRSVSLGFEPEGVLTVGVSLGERIEDEEAARFYQDVIERIAALPGVDAVGGANALPLQEGSANGGSFGIESRPRAEDALPPVAMFKSVTEGYFETMAIPVVSGRTVSSSDHSDGSAVVWINEAFASTFFPEGDAMGERLLFGASPDSTWSEIVGIVGDVRVFGIQEDIRPLAYFPMLVGGQAASSLSRMGLVVRTAGDPLSLAEGVRGVVRDLDSRVPITRVRTMEKVVSESMAATSFTMTLLGIAAGVALLLGAVGLFGVISYVVGQRTREIGVRVALGAEAIDVQRMIVRQGVRVTAVGIVVGLAGAVALTRLLQSVLFGVSATDPLTFIAAPVLLVTVSLIAAWLPARRASRVDPVQALRAE